MSQKHITKTTRIIPWIILFICLLPSICANLLYRHNLINNHDSKQNGNLILALHVIVRVVEIQMVLDMEILQQHHPVDIFLLTQKT